MPRLPPSFSNIAELFPRLLLLILLLPFHGTLVRADAPEGLQPIWNFCRRSASSTIILKGILLIDNGYETFDNGSGIIDGITAGLNEYTLAFKLSEPWSAGDNGNLSDPSAHLTSKFGRNSQSGSHPPETVRGTLFAGPTATNPDSMFLWGGTTQTLNHSFKNAQDPPDATQYSLWEKRIVSAGQDSAWLQHTVKDQANNTLDRLAAGAKAGAADRGLAFHFNGLTDSGTSYGNLLTIQGADNQFHTGMVKLDLQNMTATNMSTEDVFPLPRAGAEMVYLKDVGAKGVLVLIGGGEKKPSVVTSDSLGNLVSMSTVHLFDISSMDNPRTPNGTWYSQNTVGDIPPGRTEHCLTVFAADDGTSHNIYMFGGWDGHQSYGDMYILSLPSFKWIRAIGDAENDPRFRHSCHAASANQMLVTGGQETLNIVSDGCDKWNMSVAIFNPSELTWGFDYKATFTAPDPYRVPKLISDQIGGGATGGAKQYQPSGGFSWPELSLVFQNKSPDPPALAQTSTGSITKSQRVGMILGIVVAALAVISFAIVGRWYWVRKRKAAKEMEAQASFYVSRSSRIPHHNHHHHHHSNSNSHGGGGIGMPTRPPSSTRKSWLNRHHNPHHHPANGYYGHDQDIAELPGESAGGMSATNGTLRRIEMLQRRDMMQQREHALYKSEGTNGRGADSTPYKYSRRSSM